MSKVKTIKIDEVEYVRKDSVPELQELSEDYVIIRTYSAGVHIGYLHSKEGKEVVLLRTRRMWKWSGAFTLSEIALNGVKKPEECKFSVVIPKNILTEAIEIIPCTKEAKKNLEAVPVWTV